jgi:hypothetical protein
MKLTLDVPDDKVSMLATQLEKAAREFEAAAAERDTAESSKAKWLDNAAFLHRLSNEVKGGG